MNKQIPQDIAQELIAFIKASKFYNKFQIKFNHTEGAFNTETFYFFEGKWGHTIFKETGGQSEVLQDLQTIENDNFLITRFGTLEQDAQVLIASNSSEYILSITI